MFYNNTVFPLGIYKAKHGTLWNDRILANVCLKLIPRFCEDMKNMKWSLFFRVTKMSKEIVILLQI